MDEAIFLVILLFDHEQEGATESQERLAPKRCGFGYLEENHFIYHTHTQMLILLLKNVQVYSASWLLSQFEISYNTVFPQLSSYTVLQIIYLYCNFIFQLTIGFLYCILGILFSGLLCIFGLYI